MGSGSAVPASVSRDVVRAFYEAIASRDPDRIGQFLDDDVDWMIIGPVELLPYCGPHRGKAAVLELYRTEIPEGKKVTGVFQDYLLVDGDNVAAYSRLTGIHRRSGRVISYRIANFLRFRDNKVVEFRGMIDSLDAAEQMLGRP